ncbi:RrF2 family transcriptional regulator [Streptosporangium sp. NPDC004379]|uniref:RrF2 family transcriptional regulator n=1 Tax=Streptosporangium sp. NPDC004379 TaxID=3366189 RepID=UPI00367782FE
MRVSARTQYALRAVAELAATGPGPVPAEKVAAAQNIPRRFLDNILLQLRRAGLIHSQRGPDGGYWLARPPEEITLADVIMVIEGRPEHFRNDDYPGVARPIAHVWSVLREHEETLLSEITIAHITRNTVPGGRAEPAAGSREPTVPWAGDPAGGPANR